MPTQKLRFSRKEQEEHHSRLRQLQEMGVAVGSVGESVTKPNRFTLVQVLHDLARVYELPGDGVAVVVYADLAVFKTGAMITDSDLIVPWDDFPLELGDPEATSYYKEVLGGAPYWPPTILNRWLTGQLPLSRGRLEGVIVATGWSKVPPTWHDEASACVELLLRDEEENEFCFEFGARVDRSLKRKYKRQSQQRSAALQFTKRSGPYGPASAGTRAQAPTTQEIGGGPISPSRGVVPAEKPMEVSPPMISHEPRRANSLQR